MRIRRARPVEARRQAEWIVALEPWSSMGFKAVPLGRWLSRRARAGCVLVVADKQAILGILVFQPDFLLLSYKTAAEHGLADENHGQEDHSVEQVSGRRGKKSWSDLKR